MPPSAHPQDSPIRAIEQELEDFTYIVSHDLSACFRHIRGFGDLLKEEGLSCEQERCYAQIQTAAEKGAAMLEQLLVYSRVMRKPLEIAECELASLLDTARLQLGPEIRQSGAEIAAGDLGRAAVDRELFARVLRHLLDNAIKFRHEGAAPHIAVEAAQAEGKMRLRIADNGIGLPAVEFERLFWMFYRGHPEAAYPGCGAGLTIARRIVRRHGGDMRFLDSPAGACVEIVLPVDSAAGAP